MNQALRIVVALLIFQISSDAEDVALKSQEVVRAAFKLENNRDFGALHDRLASNLRAKYSREYIRDLMKLAIHSPIRSEKLAFDTTKTYKLHGIRYVIVSGIEKLARPGGDGERAFTAILREEKGELKISSVIPSVIEEIFLRELDTTE